VSLPAAMCQTVTVVRAGESVETPLGYSPGPSTPHDVDWCSLQPLRGVSSTESNTASADQAVTRWLLFAPPGADILASDRVQQGPLDLQVDGDPATWPGPNGRPHHVEAYLKRWEG